MLLKDAKLNQEFLMEGISLSGKTKWSKAKLVDIQGDKYIVHSGSTSWGIRITMPGSEPIKLI